MHHSHKFLQNSKNPCTFTNFLNSCLTSNSTLFLSTTLCFFSSPPKVDFLFVIVHVQSASVNITTLLLSTSLKKNNFLRVVSKYLQVMYITSKYYSYGACVDWPTLFEKSMLGQVWAKYISFHLSFDIFQCQLGCLISLKVYRFSSWECQLRSIFLVGWLSLDSYSWFGWEMESSTTW